MRKGVLLFALYLILGLYAINSVFGIVNLAFITTGINKWIISVTGFLLILEGFFYLRKGNSSGGPSQ